jgi:hypothetical protein
MSDCTICYLHIEGQPAEDGTGQLFHQSCMDAHYANAAECVAKGHDFSGPEGHVCHAGPDSASETLTCQRCGQEYSETYY